MFDLEGRQLDSILQNNLGAGEQSINLDAKAMNLPSGPCIYQLTVANEYGLFWSLFISDPVWSGNVAVFFLSCVAVAGIYGSITADKKIFWIQGFLPLLALGVYFLA